MVTTQKKIAAIVFALWCITWMSGCRKDQPDDFFIEYEYNDTLFIDHASFEKSIPVFNSHDSIYISVSPRFYNIIGLRLKDRKSRIMVAKNYYDPDSCKFRSYGGKGKPISASYTQWEWQIAWSEGDMFYLPLAKVDDGENIRMFFGWLRISREYNLDDPSSPKSYFIVLQEMVWCNVLNCPIKTGQKRITD